MCCENTLDKLICDEACQQSVGQAGKYLPGIEWGHREDTWTHGGDVYLPGGSYQLDAPGQNRKYKFKATLKRLGVLGFDSREGTRMSIV